MPLPGNGARPLPPVQLFCADLDGTLLGEPRSTERFRAAWCTLGWRCPLLVYNSGRSVQNVQNLIDEDVLPSADAIIGSVGTELAMTDDPGASQEFLTQLRPGWNLAKVDEIVGATPGVTRQPPEFLHPFKSSWFWHQARPIDVERLQRRLGQAGLAARVIYSNWRCLDVVPATGDKGRALAWLCRRFGIPFEAVLVAGDTANDSSMLRLPGVRRIVVGNALPELLADVVGFAKFCASGVLASGVLQGLRHFGVL